ncbi:uncharacterized protein [Drosophila kikkawai]|uniref:Proteasome assembly chaperone 3 n=1 Tax=Drosophila kikkawai TaxID=30033 RepID=A0A6P4JBU6_DROKI|nr:uncharacterized protein LOC108081791 [Drosophila kikkawai]KAH8304258.1 hypothetical protein KR059_005205 [Drosophila kikkawai]
MESVAVKEFPKAAGDAGQVQEAGLFTSHCFHLDGGHVQFLGRVLKMQGSTLLIVNGREAETFDELAMAMPDRYDAKGKAISASIMGDRNQTDSSILAEKLSKRYQRQFYVSVNVQMDRLLLPLFEKALVTYMHDHLEHFV